MKVPGKNRKNGKKHEETGRNGKERKETGIDGKIGKKPEAARN